MTRTTKVKNSCLNKVLRCSVEGWRGEILPVVLWARPVNDRGKQRANVLFPAFGWQPNLRAFPCRLFAGTVSWHHRLSNLPRPADPSTEIPADARLSCDWIPDGFPLYPGCRRAW